MPDRKHDKKGGWEKASFRFDQKQNRKTDAQKCNKVSVSGIIISQCACDGGKCGEKPAGENQSPLFFQREKLTDAYGAEGKISKRKKSIYP